MGRRSTSLDFKIPIILILIPNANITFTIFQALFDSFFKVFFFLFRPIAHSFISFNIALNWSSRCLKKQQNFFNFSYISSYYLYGIDLKDFVFQILYNCNGIVRFLFQK